MKCKPFFVLALVLKSLVLLAQAPNDANFTPLSGTANAANQQANAGINLYTGAPNVSFPLYQYTHPSGLSLAVTLDYLGGGGIKINEIPSPSGVGWFLNAGGVITRTVRGRPDDIDATGYMYAPALPVNYRSNASKYYYDTLDAEQDVFQFNVNGRSGKFYIGKNKQIVVVPLSKLRIGYTAAANSPITSFYMVAEDGTKYVFNDLEYEMISSSDFPIGYKNANYTTAWYLSQVIAPFGTDTIRFSYTTLNQSNAFAYPQTVYVNNNTLAVDFRYNATGYRVRYFKKLAGISFPGKKEVSISYHRLYTYDGKDSVIDKVKISDSIFRYGYLFKWFHGATYTLLDGIQLYTATGANPAYKFVYDLPYLKAVGTPGDTISNKRDHWGFYNGAQNGTNVIPTVGGVFNGANRTPSPVYSTASVLRQITDPAGGVTSYLYEPNAVCDYAYVLQNANITDVRVNTQTTITCSQAQHNLHTLKFSIPDFVTLFAPTFSGTCNLTILVTSTDGLTTYGSFATSLAELFQLGSLNFSFNGPNAQYKVSTSMSAGCTSSSPVYLNISWLNQSLLSNSVISGGVRIRQQLHDDPITQKRDTIATYSYLTADGKSSGFLGAIPKYDYPYQRTVVNGLATTTYYTAISSDPVQNTHYTQGSPVGYSRVVVYKGTPARNLGSEVYEFTTLQDANKGNAPASFPYTPIVQRDWALGLPKRIATYDSLGNLVKVKRNTFDITTVAYNNSQFQSVKQGRFSVTYNGDPNLESTPRTELYVAQGYFPETGRANLVASVDSLYHPNGSVQAAEQTMQYDTNYNLVKVISPYNKTTGLTLEKRLYYPYNYTIASGPVKKLRDSGIIGALISQESWIMGDANPRMLQAGITDYQQLPQGHIKPLMTYALQSNAPVAQSVIGVFNPASLVRNTTYLVVQQNFTVYDAKGNLLEAKNAVSGERSSIIMDYASQFPIAKVSNAPYADIAYTSFESDGAGNWTIGSPNRDYSGALTGKACYRLSDGNITKTGLTASRVYLFFVWVRSGASVTINGASLVGPMATQNNWNLYQASVTGVTSITVSGTGLIDELRLHPKEANMVTSTYEPMVGITSAADANNTVSYYGYDKLGRLQTVKDKDLNILKKYEYGNNTTAINTAPDWQNQGTECQIPLNGKVDRIEQDMNPFSDSYNTIRKIFDHNDCVTCAPTCSSPPEKLINCQCETGILVTGASVWTKETGVWKWKCTLYWKYSDCSLVFAWIEYRDTACPVTAGCD